LPGQPTACSGSKGSLRRARRKKGALWLLAASQEKLTDVVDSIEGKQTELAKAVDRFPIRVVYSLPTSTK